LPGESIESFGAGFDRLVALGPQEIQVGVLKRLRGTPIARHDDEWQMIYSPTAPYEILQNRLLGFSEMQRLRRFARCWDLVGNSGNFIETTPLIWRSEARRHSAGESHAHEQPMADRPHTASPFAHFLAFSDWLFAQAGRTDSIALARLMEMLFRYLTDERGLDKALVAATLQRDYQRSGRRDVPPFLLRHWSAETTEATTLQAKTAAPKRQARHLNVTRTAS
jgi:hypothetical protein